LNNSAIILAGGFSKRFGQEKGLVLLDGKPLILHVIEKISTLVNKCVVVVSSNTQGEKFNRVLPPESEIIVDFMDVRSPLVGALTGFKNISSEYSLLLPCDTPFVSRSVISLLLELCVNKAAVIPRWTNGYIEPLQAVYNVDLAKESAKKALTEGSRDMGSMVEKMRGIRYVSTLVLRQLDPQLSTFFNINTPIDLKKAEAILKRQKRGEGESLWKRWR
jgi:molybdopterin-guanine dinucleotide biosynthesis protein A